MQQDFHPLRTVTLAAVAAVKCITCHPSHPSKRRPPRCQLIGHDAHRPAVHTAAVPDVAAVLVVGWKVLVGADHNLGAHVVQRAKPCDRALKPFVQSQSKVCRPQAALSVSTAQPGHDDSTCLTAVQATLLGTLLPRIASQPTGHGSDGPRQAGADADTAPHSASCNARSSSLL